MKFWRQCSQNESKKRKRNPKRNFNHFFFVFSLCFLRFCVFSKKQVKIQKEALNTLSADIDMLVELMEHPVKKQNTIKALLADMKKVTKDALK